MTVDLPRFSSNQTVMQTRTTAFFIIAAGIALSACSKGRGQAKALRDQCDAGNAKACHGFAVKLTKGEYVLRDEAGAALLFEKACRGKVADGCAQLGLLYQEGTGVKRDTTRAPELYRQGCDGGSMMGCTRLGIVYRRDEGVAAYSQRGTAVLQKG